MSAMLKPKRTFQSTLPARGATFPQSVRHRLHLLFQSTLPARGATWLYGCVALYVVISIHAPRTGSDFAPIHVRTCKTHFNPRSPHGERLCCNQQKQQLCNFNPRSPHGERPPRSQRPTSASHFNPRSPHGERRLQPPGRGQQKNFNPRSPHGERHGHALVGRANDAISIHAPRTGSDKPPSGSRRRTRRFQSTLPARGATAQ